MAAITTDPRGVAAKIFGIDISSIFFEIATDPTIMPMLAPFTDPVQAYNRNFAVPADVDPNLFESDTAISMLASRRSHLQE
jgi:hypothetical protein